MRLKTNKPKSVWIRGIMGVHKIWVGRLGIIATAPNGFVLLLYGKPSPNDMIFAGKVSDLKATADQLWDMIHREQPNA